MISVFALVTILAPLLAQAAVPLYGGFHR
ncbi:hypothetical protein PIIN_11508 [Serendipita indica DSM 11827]|uniref:Uncharacterized protein n=1 Tax=Serendipita indica (strain DSM 11827) TaxID=1109443 RepID=G4U1T8_SERID|nr:hypothetical protein PIIN_11508 [Serendipita indica DSM 11827]